MEVYIFAKVKAKISFDKGAYKKVSEFSKRNLQRRDYQKDTPLHRFFIYLDRILRTSRLTSVYARMVV